MKVLVAGGGTGGHFYPALSVMKKIKKDSGNHRISYLGTGNGLESKVAPSYDWLDFETITVTGLSRNSLPGFLRGLALLPVGLMQTFFVIRRFKPDLIYGTGGYTTFPPAFWGVILRIPVIIHELNLKPGITNRIIARFATRVLLSYSDTKDFLPASHSEVTGTPVREGIREENSDPDPRKFGLEKELPVILVFGGSRGSRILSEKLLEELEGTGDLEDIPFQLLIQTGREKFPGLEERFKSLKTNKVSVVEYIEDMGSAYSLSDLVICRGGAGTMAELIAARKPAIIVPWKGASENHQYWNAKLLEEKGAALLVKEEDWPKYPLLDTLKEVVTSREKLEELSNNYRKIGTKNGSDNVINVFKDIINKGETC